MKVAERGGQGGMVRKRNGEKNGGGSWGKEKRKKKKKQKREEGKKGKRSKMVQLLLAEIGKNSNLEAIPIVVAVSLVVLSLVFFPPFRAKIRTHRIKIIPRKYIPIEKSNLPRGMYRTIQEELMTSVVLEMQPNPDEVCHVGWGDPNSEFKNIHFKSSLARSPALISKALIRSRPEWVGRKDMTVREHLEFLREQCPYLSVTACQAYVEGYERARYSDEEFTMEDYTDFMKHTFSILNALDVATK
eukprot:TRINITY_DN2508_c0_g1_i2.p1 TRINITY_DN2508_c0_g1~~TRINITY_DN2508_c0_g1_i2.p1  ORF type:complete len:245 (-),score=59.00 TRINITY_DN2508_c0_g1_i2:864-1598(-)